MMLSVLLLSCSILVTHAPGWSFPMITTDMWTYSSGPDNALEVTGLDTLHQAWETFNQETRVGYKVYQPDGTVLYPETMLSNDVWSANPTSTIINGDSVVFIWRESSPVWFTIRESSGEAAIPSSLLLTDPYAVRPEVRASSDSLGRLHIVFEKSVGVCYMVYEPGVGEVRRDTIASSQPDGARILVDGDRVHIVYQGSDSFPDYIQFDLDGNITVPAISLVEDLSQFMRNFTMALDGDRNLYCLFMLSREIGPYISLFKIDGGSGDVLIYDRVINDNYYNTTCQTILPTPSGNTIYLLWLEVDPLPGGNFRYICFSIIDKNGDFIEEPYVAYDYTDEDPENIFVLDATVNDEGDIFTIWSAYFPEVHMNAYYIVMGWFDHNWVGVVEESTAPVETEIFRLYHSANPFYESMTITVEGTPVPDQLSVYDLSGRIVRTLFRNGSSTFLWDGCNTSGDELPVGTYIIEGASEGRLASVTVVKL